MVANAGQEIGDIERPHTWGLVDVEEMNGHVTHMVPRSFVTETSSACLILEIQVCMPLQFSWMRMCADAKIVIP